MASVREVLTEQSEHEARSLLITAATGGTEDEVERAWMRDLPLDTLTRIALDNVVRQRDTWR